MGAISGGCSEGCPSPFPFCRLSARNFASTLTPVTEIIVLRCASYLCETTGGETEADSALWSCAGGHQGGPHLFQILSCLMAWK